MIALMFERCQVAQRYKLLCNTGTGSGDNVCWGKHGGRPALHDSSNHVSITQGIAHGHGQQCSGLLSVVISGKPVDKKKMPCCQPGRFDYVGSACLQNPAKLGSRCRVMGADEHIMGGCILPHSGLTQTWCMLSAGT